ncbi:hypothetical protein GIB67_015766 [Kingdonia uniflora]|uniref:RRM domain-containing protein n=1 Tax=Kingdonia uniflora TaxID=39325 RepID=A0A7J7NV31_9MAGN|nr:hypothetical protein GIB67_015766 [Kingdonia uniflora]
MKTREGARKALKEPQKMIGSRMTSCQLASAGPAPTHSQAASDTTGRKLYVANVGPQVNPERLRAFFAKFGEIEEGPIGCDRNTGMPRGYAIFVYKTPEGCKKALEEPIKVFEGCQFQCKRAAEGGRGNNNQMGPPNVVAPLGLASGMPQHDFGLAYAMGLNPEMMGQSLNPATSLMIGQNPGMFLNHPGFDGLMNYAAFGNSGISPSIPTVGNSGTGDSLGLSSVYGGQSGINGVSPSIMGSYNFQAGSQGLGAYQSTQFGQSPSATAARSQSGIGSVGTYPSYSIAERFYSSYGIRLWASSGGSSKEYNLVTDKLLGKAMGHCFVLIVACEGACKALKEPHKMVGDLLTSCQLALAGSALCHCLKALHCQCGPTSASFMAPASFCKVWRTRGTCSYCKVWKT